MNNSDFRTLFQASPDLYLILSPDLKIVEVNNAYTKATMTKRGEIIGKDLFDIFPNNPNDLSTDGAGNFGKSLQRMMKSEMPDAMLLQKYDIRIAGTEDFEERYWNSLNTPVLDEYGELKYIIHRAEDMTEYVRLKKKETEQAKITEAIQKTHEVYHNKLKENEEKFRILAERAKKYANFMVDTTGHVKSWNEGAQQIEGYSADEIIGKHISVFYTEEAVKKGEPAQNLKTTKENGNFESEGWRVQKDGTKYWANVLYTALYDDAGKLKGYSKITRDLTVKRFAEKSIMSLNKELEKNNKKLKETEEKFEKAFQGSPVGITISRLSDGMYADINDSFIRITGYSKEELLNNSAIKLGLIPDVGKYLNVWKQIKEHGFSKDVEMKVRNKSGKMLEILCSAETIMLKGEKHVLNIIYDNSERKKVEEELLNINLELDGFSYSVSHDLRAPLRAIIGFAKMFEEDYGGSLSEDGARKLGVIRENAQKMGILIDDLLTLSRLGRKPVQKSAVNMGALVESVLLEIDKTKHYKAIIKTGDLKPAYADYSLIFQVMMNLLSNAIKYSSKIKIPLIEIGSEEKDKEIIYWVKDNGTGFDMKYSDKLFKVFQRLHSEEEFEGTGVGLAIVQRLISKHEGKVWAKGEVNKGAEFYFSLPK